MSFSDTLVQPLYLTLGAGCGIIWIAGRLLNRRAYARFTVLDDLAAIGHPRPDGKIGQTAVVCGGRSVSSPRSAARLLTPKPALPACSAPVSCPITSRRWSSSTLTPTYSCNVLSPKMLSVSRMAKTQTNLDVLA
jgi:hypothetical protein